MKKCLPMTWIHNVMNTDALALIDDMDCKKMLQVMTDEAGVKFLNEFADTRSMEFMKDKFGISSICDVIGAIKMAKHYRIKNENIVIVATDGIDRNGSVPQKLNDQVGKLGSSEAKSRIERIFHRQEPSFMVDGNTDS